MAVPGIFLTARWRYLAMINFEVAPDLIYRRVPTGTELDTWNGKTLISVVGFLFLDTRVFGWQFPFHTNFEEVNLRFYVRRRTGQQWRRGVVFIKEIVPRWAIAEAARRFYHENYVAMPMRHRIALSDQDGTPQRGDSISYSWRNHSRWNSMGLSIDDSPKPASVGSEEEFITDHLFGYGSLRDGSTIEYEVSHPNWLLCRAGNAFLDCDVASLYGPEFTDCLSENPSSALLACGSQVTVRRGARL